LPWLAKRTLPARHDPAPYGKDEAMSDDNEYERKRDEASQLADMEAQLEPGLAEPVPAGFDAERDVDLNKVEHLIFSDAPPEVRAAIRTGELRWGLSGFDGQGWGWVSVFRADTGEEVAGARCHWSAIVRRTQPL
jgi:hypothetical protein